MVSARAFFARNPRSFGCLKKSSLASENLHRRLIRDLVRGGVDQCQAAIRKLSRTNHDIDALELRLDNLSLVVDEIMARLRAIQRKLRNTYEEEVKESSDDWSSSGPTEETDAQDYHEPCRNENALPLSSNASFDPHPYATKKRKDRESVQRRKRPTMRIRNSNESRRRQSARDPSIRNVPGKLLPLSQNRNTFCADDSPGVLNSNAEGNFPELFSRQNSSQSNKRRKHLTCSMMDNDFPASSAIASVRSKTSGNLNRGNVDCDKDPTCEEISSRSSKASSVTDVNDMLIQNVRQRIRPATSIHKDATYVCPRSPCTRNSFESLCQAIKTTFPDKLRHEQLRDAVLYVSSESRQHEAPTLFKTLYDLLQTNSTVTLQELVATEKSSLASYVYLHVSILDLVEKRLNESLTEADGICFHLFGPDRCSRYVDLVLQQLVDVIYALVHPDAWALKIRHSNLVCSRLEPLRDALTMIIPVMERVCQCIKNQLSRQVWRIVEDRKVAFVSSVDPRAWELFIRKAEINTVKCVSRFDSFGSNVIPQCEAKALWALLSFFAITPSPVTETKESLRWTFVPNILLRSSLLSADEVLDQRPAIDQLLAISYDLNCFAHIVLSGSMYCLPRQDSALIEIAKKVITLQATDCVGKTRKSNELDRTIVDGKKYVGHAYVVWDQLGKNKKWRILEPATPASIARTLLSDRNVTDSILVSDVVPGEQNLRYLMGLVIAWVDLIPENSLPRWKRFDMATEALLRNVDVKSSARANSNVRDADRFNEAFPGASPSWDCSFDAANTLLKEYSCWIKLCSFIKNMHRIEFIRLCRDTWEMIADNALNDRLQAATSTEATDTSHSFSGDPRCVLIATRLLTSLSLMAIGVCPFNSLAEAPLSFAILSDVPRLAFDYLIARLRVCLECSVDSRNPEIAANVSRLVIFVIEILQGRISNGNGAPNLAGSFGIELVDNVLKGCNAAFASFLTSAACGVEGDVCLMMLLSTFKATLWLHSTIERRLKSTRAATLAFTETYKILKHALDDAKPSNLYAIPRSKYLAMESTCHQAKTLIHRRASLVCDLLASLCEQKSFATRLCELLMFHEPSSREDIKYKMKLREFLASSFCRNAVSSEQAAYIVVSNHHHFVIIFLEAMLRIESISKAPSCNINRIVSYGGSEAERKALVDYELYRKKRVTAPCWLFRRDLGSVLMRATDESSRWPGTLGRFLHDSSSDRETSDSVDLVPSLEKECLERIRCLREILRLSRKTPGANPCFEDLSKLIICSCADQLSLVLSQLTLAQRVRNNAGIQSYRELKSFELLSSYGETFVGLLAVIIREGRGAQNSARLSQIEQSICDEFVSPILRDESFPVATYLHRLKNSLKEASHKEDTELVFGGNEYDPENVRRMIVECLVRHAREWLTPLAKSDSFSASILQAVVAAGIREKGRFAKQICKALFATSTLALPSYILDSPLRLELEKYYEYIENSSPPMDDRGSASFLAFRNDAMKTSSHILRIESSSVERKTGSLVFLHELFIEDDRQRPNGTYDRQILCQVARALSLAFMHELSSSQVSNELLSLVFICASSFLRLIDSHMTEVKVIVKSCAWCTVSRGEPPGCDPRHEYTLYIASFFCWLKAVSNDFCHITDSSTLQKIEQCRSVLVTGSNNNSNDTRISSWMMLGEKGDTMRMLEYEERIFHGVHKSTGITNVYANGRSKMDRSIQPYQPNDEVMRAAKKFTDTFLEQSC